MYGAHQGTSQMHVQLARAQRIISIQWGNKREKMQQNKRIESMLKTAAKVNSVHCEKLMN